jgi:hypothetical protein
MSATTAKSVDFPSEWRKAVDVFHIILNALETGKGIQYKEWMATYKYERDIE